MSNYNVLHNDYVTQLFHLRYISPNYLNLTLCWCNSRRVSNIFILGLNVGRLLCYNDIQYSPASLVWLMMFIYEDCSICILYYDSKAFDSHYIPSKYSLWFEIISIFESASEMRDDKMISVYLWWGTDGWLCQGLVGTCNADQVRIF